MQIKIRENARDLYIAYQITAHMPINEEWADKLGMIEGQIIEVETEFLFQTQFNTPEIVGVSESGMRIMAQSVEYVLNDERHGKMRCQWCGKTNEQSNTCPDCGKSDYVKWFYVFYEKCPSVQMLDPWE